MINNVEKVDDYMLPTTDFVFKRIFGYEGNEDICMDLISSIIGKKVKNLKYKNPYMYRDFFKDKEIGRASCRERV